MDPNRAYAELAEAIEDYQLKRFNGQPLEAMYAADDLLAKFSALDTWLAGGGFLPRAWDGATKAE